MDSIFDLDHLYRTYFKMALPSVFGLMVSVVYNLSLIHISEPTRPY